MGASIDASLAMSDEDFMNLPMTDDEPEEKEVEVVTEPEEEPEVEEEVEPEVEPEEEEIDEDAEEETEEEVEEGEVEEVEKDAEPEGDKEAPEKEVKEEPTDDTEIDYKALYEQVMAPMKANGKDLTLDNPDDLRKLAQMGSGFQKKMMALKPNLRLMKMLDKNDLLDEAKLSYLIDLDKKNPEAIQKFMKDSGVDPLDIDPDKASDYRPNTYAVGDKELDLDSALEDIKATETYDKTIDILANKWDDSSKEALTDEPNIIRIINDHVADGTYDQIMTVVDRDKMLGKLEGMSDLEAYIQTGKQLQANSTPAKVGEATVIEPSKDTAKQALKLKSQKKAVSKPKKKTTTKVKKDFNPLAMSDEEFSKMADGDFT